MACHRNNGFNPGKKQFLKKLPVNFRLTTVKRLPDEE